MPDVFQIIVKEKGVFTNVTSPSTKAKLRILFEVGQPAAGMWLLPDPNLKSSIRHHKCQCYRNLHQLWQLELTLTLPRLIDLALSASSAGCSSCPAC